MNNEKFQISIGILNQM